MQRITKEILGEEVTVYWNYRLMKRIDGAGTPYEEPFLYVVEVYYDENNQLIGWTEDKTVYGEDLAEIRQTLEWMLLALDKPVLVEADLLAELHDAKATGKSKTFSEEAFKPIETGRVFETAEELIAHLSEVDENEGDGINGVAHVRGGVNPKSLDPRER